MPPKRWQVSFQSSDTLRDRDRRPSQGTSPCARGENCSAATITDHDGERTTTPALASGVLCSKCHGRMYRSLASAPELWVRLHIELGNKGQARERVSGSRSAPVPLNVAADALLREHIFILASWDERVRTAASLVPADTQGSRQRRDGPLVAALVRTLTAHLDTLLRLPPGPMLRSWPLHDLSLIPEGLHGWSNRAGGYAEGVVDLAGVDAAEEILRLNHRSRSMLGETRMRERLDVPCPDPACDMLMLERVQGSDYAAECGACGRLLSLSEYHQWVRLYANSLSHADLPAVTPAA